MACLGLGWELNFSRLLKKVDVFNNYLSLWLCVKAKGGAAASGETHGRFLGSNVFRAVLLRPGCVPPQQNVCTCSRFTTGFLLGAGSSCARWCGCGMSGQVRTSLNIQRMKVQRGLFGT